MKRLLISHIGDEDGITPVILARLVFGEIDTLLLQPRDVDEAVLNNINKYDEIHVVDLNVSEDLASKIDDSDNWKNKIKVFDHHKSALPLNKYDFITVIDDGENRKESGTSIYYNYLTSISDNEILHKNSTKGLVEQVRLVDTYDFKTKDDEKAKDLDYIFALLGYEKYIDYFTEYLEKNEEFKYGPNEELLIGLERDRVKNYVLEKEKEMFPVKLDEHKAAVVFAESYRSQVGNMLLELHPEYDFIIIINISRSISFRGNGKADLSIISNKRGGGGHKNAAGIPLSSDILRKITKMIFTDIVIEDKVIK